MTEPTVEIVPGGDYEVRNGNALLGAVSRDHGIWTATKAVDGRVTRYSAGYIGRFTSKQSAVDAVVGSSYCQIEGNIFPDGLYILRIHDISVDVNPSPGATPTIIAKVHYNSLKATGRSTASKPARAHVMYIDLDSGEIQHGDKVMQFINQDEILEKVGVAIRGHLTQGQS